MVAPSLKISEEGGVFKKDSEKDQAKQAAELEKQAAKQQPPNRSGQPTPRRRSGPPRVAKHEQRARMETASSRTPGPWPRRHER